MAAIDNTDWRAVCRRQRRCTVDSSESPNRMDALVWALVELMRGILPDEGEASVF